MPVPVKLSDVLEHLSIVTDDVSVYFNKCTGEFVVLSSDDGLGFEDEDDFADLEDPEDPDWLEEWDEEFKKEYRQRKELLNSPDYVALPDKFDIHDWQIMNDFCRAQSDRIRDELLGLIRGGGAFRRFHDAIDRMGIVKKWLQFQNEAYERIAREWLETFEIQFIDDCQLPSTDLKESERRKSNPRLQGSDVRDSQQVRPQSALPKTKTTETNPKSDEIKVFISHQNSHCAECDEDLEKKAWITLERDKGALCLACADLDELVFLPAGDAALTRRSKKYSNLSAVVLKFSKSRGRYERQGLLVEESAIEQAEAECLADSEVRERRNERARERRAELDEEYVREFGRRIREVFPNCPTGREHSIAEHACLKYSGRVGRSAAAKEFDEQMITLAVTAHVRHRETNYDALLGSGWSRFEARAQVRDSVVEIVESWK